MTSKQLVSRLTFVATLAAGAAAAGCASITPDCAQNWHDAGASEGRVGMPSWDLQYQKSCAARFDRAQYLNGWQEGFADHPG